MKRTNFLGQVNGRFSATDEDPIFGAAFYLEAVQLVNIEREYTDWVTLDMLCFEKYSKETLLSVGKNMKEWKKLKEQISNDYSEGLNYLTEGNTTPFKQVVALKIRYLGEPKNVTHVFHYYAPRNP